MSSFTKKKIEATISLGEGAFGESGADTVTLTGYRTVVNIGLAGGESMGALQMRLYGVKQDLMNKLTTIGPFAPQIRRNTVSISAGDSETGMSQIFTGTINTAWGDYQGTPDVSLNLTAFAGLLDAVKPVPPNSYKGSADVAEIMGNLAKIMGVSFENNGVQVRLDNPCFPGTAWQQVQSCARAADIRYALDRGVLAIWPKLGYRAGGIPLISPETGMVGYPTFSSQGLGVTMLFNPNVQLGGQIQVQSSLRMATGNWIVDGVSHALESERPGGAWFTQAICHPNTPTGTVQ